GLQSPDDIGSVDFAHFQGLQIDLDTPAVQGGVSAVHADEGRKTLNRWILQNQMSQLLLLFRHGREGDGLPRLRNSLNDARILYREETLGDDDVENDGEHQRARGYQQSCGL